MNNSNDNQDERTYQRLDIHPSVIKKLSAMQRELKVPKTRKMRIGSQEVPYRNAEDILSAAKQMMGAGWAIITQYDEYRESVTGTPMLSCTANIVSEEGYFSGVTFSVPVEGLGAQKKGAARSYALKYALCDLFGIDDGIDDDTLTAATGKLQTPAPKVPQVPLEQAIADVQEATSKDDRDKRMRKYPYYYGNAQFKEACIAKLAQLKESETNKKEDSHDNA